MEPKRFSDVLRQFAALFHPSPKTAIADLRDIFSSLLDIEGVMVPPDLVELSIDSLAKGIRMAQEELDEKWRLDLLRNLCVLASTNQDFTQVLAECRGKLDFMLYMSDAEVLASNTSVYLEMSSKISEMACQTTLPESISSSTEKRFTVITSQRRLIDWVNRFVTQDLYRRGLAKDYIALDVRLSSRAQYHMDRSRDSTIQNHVSAEIFEFVYSSIDRRELWHEFDKQGFSEKEIAYAAFAAGGAIKDAVDADMDGDFKEFARARGPPSQFPKRGTYVIPEFRQMPLELQVHAQSYYDQGHTVEEALRFAQDELAPAVDAYKSRRVIAAEVDQKGPSEDTRIDDDSDDRKMKFDEPHRATMVDGIKTSFPHEGFIQFANISLGLTPVIAADVDSIRNNLKQAFNQELPLTKPCLNSWMRIRQDRTIWTVALSYKHLSREVRMGERTQRKIACVLSELAKQQGFNRMTIWLDTILSRNKHAIIETDQGSWAVNGIYPYLTSDVVRLIGNDEEYQDRDGSSMWMKVEEMCADKKSCYTVRLDTSNRGFSYGRDTIGSYEPADVRMMNLARFIVKGGLVEKLVSWVSDKKQLVLWAEASMIANQPLLMEQKELSALFTLRIDNLVSEHADDKSNKDLAPIQSYLAKAGNRDFIQRKSRRGTISGWLGLFEFFPGMTEASHHRFVPLFPYVYPDCVRVALSPQFDHVMILGTIGKAIAFHLELNMEMNNVLNFESSPCEDYEFPELEYIAFDVRDLDEFSWR